jgi:transcriptional regulator with XRE-family HTH domain
MKLHERLRELRQERGLRLKDVSETAAISIPYLSDLERGRTNPSLDTLQTLAGGLRSERPRPARAGRVLRRADPGLPARRASPTSSPTRCSAPRSPLTG